MNKFYGPVGFAVNTKTSPGVYEDVEIERSYYGDVIRNVRRLQSSGELNDNVVISNEISIVADPFANENFHSIRYVVYMNAKWKVTSIEEKYPRLILTLGGVYNG